MWVFLTVSSKKQKYVFSALRYARKEGREEGRKKGRRSRWEKFHVLISRDAEDELGKHGPLLKTAFPILSYLTISLGKLFSSSIDDQ